MEMKLKILYTNMDKFYKEEFTKTCKEMDIVSEFVDINKISIIFKENPIIYKDDGTELTGDFLFIKGTSINYRKYALLAKAFHAKGGILLDGLDRFNGYSPTKEISSVNRSLSSVGIQTNFYTKEFIQNNPQLIEFPLFIKPTDGHSNEGLKLIENIEQLNQVDLTNIIIQPNVNIVNEYRVLGYVESHKLEPYAFIYKKTIGLKDKKYGKHSKKVDSKTKYNLWEFIDKYLYTQNIQGLIGFDVAQLEDNSYVIIEENYAPEWKRVHSLLNINISEKIINQFINLYVEKITNMIKEGL